MESFSSSASISDRRAWPIIWPSEDTRRPKGHLYPHSCRRHRGYGSVCRADSLVALALWFIDHGAYPAADSMVWQHGKIRNDLRFPNCPTKKGERNSSVRCNQTSIFSLPAHGQCRECGSIVDCKLLIDVVQMDLDRTIGNIQPVPDLLVRQSF